MALKYKYAKREEIPAEQAALYVERDGAFVLDAEGATEKAKADEMRNHNVELRKQIEQLNARFEGINPEEVRKLAAEKQLSAATAERDSLTARLTAIQIDQGIITAATKRGLRPTAIPDITARARTVFKLVNGAPRAFDTDGTTLR